MDLVSVRSSTAFNVAVGGWAAGTVNVRCPTAINVAMGGWAVGTVTLGCPTACNKAVGGCAVGTISVVSLKAFYVAVAGWAAGTVVAEISVSHGCHGSKMLAPIGANQGKNGGCTRGSVGLADVVLEGGYLVLGGGACGVVCLGCVGTLLGTEV